LDVNKDTGFSYTGYIVYKKKREESHDPSLFTC
jgi:hypothetical protein